MKQFLLKLKLLLWKNLTLKRRQPVVIAIEILCPLVLAVTLSLFRLDPNNEPQRKDAITFAPRALPSAGLVPFLQGIVCDPKDQLGSQKGYRMDNDKDGFVNLNPNISEIIGNLTEMLNDPHIGWSRVMEIPRDLQNVSDDWRQLLDAQQYKNDGVIPLSELISNQTLLRNFLLNKLNLSQSSVDAFMSSSLNVSHLQQLSSANTASFYQCLLNPFAPNTTSCHLEKSVLFSPSLYRSNIARIIQATQQGDGNLLQREIRELLITSALASSLSCRSGKLDRVFEFRSKQDKVDVENVLCHLSDTQREELARNLASGLSVSKVAQVTGLPDSLSLYNRLIADTKKLTSDYESVSRLQFYMTALYEADPDMWELQPVRSAYRGPVGGDPVSVVNSVGSRGVLTKHPDRIKHDVKCRLLCGRYTAYCKSTGSSGSEPLKYASGYEAKGARKEKSVASRIEKGVKILYAPQIPAVEKVIHEANRTFEQVASFGRLATTVANYTASLKSLVENLMLSSNLTELIINQLCYLPSPTSNETKGSSSNLQFVDQRDVKEWIDMLRREAMHSNGSLPDQLDDSDATLNRYCSYMRQFYSMLSDGKLQTLVSMVDILAEGVADQLNDLQLDVWVGFPDEDSLDEFASQSAVNDSTIWGGVVFTELLHNESLPSHVQYKIKMNKTLVFDPGQLRDKDWRPGPRDFDFDHLYEVFGFVYIQDLIDRAIVNVITNKTVIEPGGYIQQFPYPCYNFDRFAASLYQYGLLSVVLVFSWVFSVAMIIRNVVHEKEQRMKEMMKIMGVSGSSLWISWFVMSFLSVAVSSLILTCILTFGRVFIHSNFLVILLFFLNYGMAIVMMCFFFSTLFSRANLAAVAGGILYLLMYIPFVVYRNYEYDFGFSRKSVLCLSATTAFASGCNYVARWEEMGDGMQWYNIGESTVPGDSFSFLSANVFIAIDALLYAILVWYIDNVFPGQYGIPRPWYFPLQLSYWCGNRRHNKAATYTRLSSRNSSVDGDEDLVEDVTVGVSMRNLVKIYRGGKVAVDDLTLDLFEGQITCLLGRNGAGKTTTMSVLTGLFPPTSGVVSVLGRDVTTDIDSIRKELGFCPQHNILFNKLTVEEHLKFFRLLKCPLEKRSEVKEIVNRWLDDLSLTSKRKVLVNSLSGGMKRKLSVALAFIGGSRLVVLDEPTAGVDPYARRGIWDLLARHKERRTIVLSTHYMDEADILSDQVAIISHGKLCFVGTPLALKRRLSTGYRLTLVKQLNGSDSPSSHRNRDEDTVTVNSRAIDRQPPDSHARHAINCMQNSVDCGTSLRNHDNSQRSPPVPTFDAICVTRLVQSYISDACLVEESETEACYAIPATAARDSHFSSLLKELDLWKERLAIASYGVSDSSFDQAFLAVTADTDSDVENSAEETQSWLDCLYPRHWWRSCTSTADVDVPLVETTQCDENQTEEGDDSTAPLILEHDTDSQNEDVPEESRWLTRGLTFHWQCFKAVIIKRFLHTKRDVKGLICQAVLPLLFICVALLVEHFKPEPKNSQIELSPSVYPGGNYFPFKNFQMNESQAAQLNRVVEQPCGVSSHFLIEHLNRSPCIEYMNSFSSNTTNGDGWWVAPSHNDWLSFNVTCSCSRGRQICPSGVASPFPPYLRTIDGITVQDLADRVNVTDYLMKTIDAYELHRYGGLTVGNENTQYETVKEEGYYKQLIEMLGVRKAAKAWFNNRGYHASPIYVNVLNNAVLRANLDNSQDISQYGITTYSDPFSWTASQLLIEKMQSGYDFLFAIFAMISVSFIPPTFIMFLIQERANGAKHQQFMSGLQPLIYWMASLTWDLLSYSWTVLCLATVFLAFQEPVFTSSQSFPAVVALFISYGWAMTPLLYLTTFVFRDSSLAYVSMLAVSVLSGLLTTVSSAILQFLQQYDDTYDDMSSFLHRLFLVFPSYCLGQGLVDIAYDYYTAQINEEYGDLGVTVRSVGPFSQDQHAIGMSLVVMVIEGIGCALLVVLVEYKFFASYWLWSCRKTTDDNSKREDEEHDVAMERRKVLGQRNKTAVLQLVRLSKVYGRSFQAVDDVCLSVSKGECFGLLGVNGAGKTTIFRMLTGDLSVTSGDAILLGQSVVRNVRHVRHRVGYCPQFDAINEKLTGRENLMLHARLRGMTKEELKQNVNWCLDKLALSEYADVITGKYSGGNKRKLSAAIALVGRPPIVLLDEPTTGMDPSARRFLWEVIRSLVQDGHSVILTSHSMEECEAVCERIGIMVNGHFVCLGSPQHLKSRYGNGYTVTLRVRENTEGFEVIRQFFADIFPSAVLKAQHYNMMQFQLVAEDALLSQIFAELHSNGDYLNIKDYSVSQTTLDDIFLGFAERQRDSTEECNKRGALWRRTRVVYHAGQQRAIVQYPSDNTSENSLEILTGEESVA